jgi:hypothetical protein
MQWKFKKRVLPLTCKLKRQLSSRNRFLIPLRGAILCFYVYGPQNTLRKRARLHLNLDARALTFLLSVVRGAFLKPNSESQSNVRNVENT